MDAKGLLNAMVAYYMDEFATASTEAERRTRIGAADMLIHAAAVALDLNEEAAAEWVDEEIAQRVAARA